jgi:hypothetical protein
MVVYGGCHYSGACTRYLQSCGACPTLGSKQIRRICLEPSFCANNKRGRHWPLTLITPSRWLAQLAATQRTCAWPAHRGHFPIVWTPTYFKPSGVLAARRELKLPEDGYVVLFSRLAQRARRAEGLSNSWPRHWSASPRSSAMVRSVLVVLGMNPPANPAAVPDVVRYRRRV